MARQIFREQIPSEMIETEEDENIQTEQLKAREDTVITSEEMKELLNEWDITGRTDLTVNSTLAARIRSYLDYQKELDPLKEELAERIYKPYLVERIGYTSANIKFYINDNFVGVIVLNKSSAGEWGGTTNLAGFKTVLLAIKNQYAQWIKVENDKYIDLRGYIVNNEGSFEIQYNSLKINI